MNYTGGPSISGCRPVLSLYPTHCFCQYLLLIFITFTNSVLFNRAFSTNSRKRLGNNLSVKGSPFGGAGERSETERARPLTENHRHRDSIALTKSLPIAAQWLFPAGLALSVIASQCHLSQRERLWQAGSLPTGRLRLDIAQEGGPCLRGQRLLDNAPCQAVAGLDSGALLLPRYCASLVQTKADRYANGSPFGGAGEEQGDETERARPLPENHRHRDRIALTKSLPIAAPASLSRRACPLRHCFAMPPLPKGEALAGRKAQKNPLSEMALREGVFPFG